MKKLKKRPDKHQEETTAVELTQRAIAKDPYPLKSTKNNKNEEVKA